MMPLARHTMMTNTENPRGEKSAKAAVVRVAMAKSAVQALISGAFIVIIFSIFYLFGFHFTTSPQGIIAVVGAGMLGAFIGSFARNLARMRTGASRS